MKTFVSLIGKGLALTDLLFQVARERRVLARLSDDQLNDVGISRKDANAESSRSLFEIPANRLKRKRRSRDCRADDTATHQSVARFRYTKKLPKSVVKLLRIG